MTANVLEKVQMESPYVDCHGKDGGKGAVSTIVHIPADDQVLRGELVVPPAAAGIVICAGPRTDCAATAIRGEGNATLRLNLLTAQEQGEDALTHSYCFDVGLLTKRLMNATRWVAHQPATANLGLGYFGESFAGAAALGAAAELGVVIDAVVCRQTRPDFAAKALPRIEAATLLICSKNDEPLLTVNRSAMQLLKCEKQLQVIPPPCKPGSEMAVRDCVGCSLAASWFHSYVRGR